MVNEKTVSYCKEIVHQHSWLTL